MSASNSESTCERPSNEIPSPRGDGGLLGGWRTVLAAWSLWFFWGFLLKGLGVLLPTFQVQFVTQTWVIGWIIAMMTGAVGLSGLFAGPLGKYFGSGRVFIVCGLMVSGGFMAASFTDDPVQLALLLTIVVGSALGFANVLSREAVGICFNENYVTASAISQTGLSVAMFVSAPLTQLFLDTYGWRGTMLLLGGMSAHLICCGQLLHQAMSQEKRREYEMVSDDENPAEDERSPERRHGRMIRLCRGRFQSIVKLDYTLLCNISFLANLVLCTCWAFPFDMWYIYFISLAESKGFSSADAVVFVTYAGIGNIIFKIAHAPLVDRNIIGLRPMLAGCYSLCFFCLILTPWINEYWSMSVSATVNIGCVSIITNLWEVLVKETMGKERLASAFGWYAMIGGGIRISLGFFPGWIYDQTGSFDLPFLIFGGMQVIALLTLGCLVYAQRNRDSNSDRNTD